MVEIFLNIMNPVINKILQTIYSVLEKVRRIAKENKLRIHSE